VDDEAEMDGGDGVEIMQVGFLDGERYKWDARSNTRHLSISRFVERSCAV